MHVAFIPYGIKKCVDELFIDMMAQKFQMPIWKGEEKKFIYIQGSLRLMPFGVVEYVFPKEYETLVLEALDFDKPQRYGHKFKSLPLIMLRKALALENAKPFTPNTNKLLWIRENVNFIPLGVRYDAEVVDPEGIYKGWSHEAL